MELNTNTSWITEYVSKQNLAFLQATPQEQSAPASTNSDAQDASVDII